MCSDCTPQRAQPEGTTTTALWRAACSDSIQMRIALLVILAGVTSTAFADDECKVRVVKAPKRIRAAIEARAGIESACTALEIRVTKQRKIFRIIATTEDGEVREGTARDAGRIAELVMSWAAPSEPVAVVEEPPPSVVAETPPPTIDEPVEELAPSDRIVVTARPRESSRDIGVGVLATPIAYAIRGEADILAWRGFSLGLAFGAGNSTWSTGDAMTGASLELRDLSGAAYAAKTFGTGTWRLRMQGGIGFVYTQFAAKTRAAPFEPITEGDGTTRMIEASVTVSRELGSSWAVSLGPLMTYYEQTFTIDAEHASTRDLDVGGYLAIKKRL